jgi:hypothetical protein
MRNYFIFTLVLFINVFAFAQKKAETLSTSDLDKLSNLETQMAVLAKTMLLDSFENNRLAAHEKLMPMVREALNTPNSFNYTFEKVEHISIQYAPDRSFRIITLQLMKDWAHYKYFGFIQPNLSKSKLYELKDFSKDIQKPENQVLGPEKWFGSLYYNIRQFKSKEGAKYLLFGFNAHDTIEKIKVVDVLTMNGGMPKFGSPVFERQERGITKKSNRLVFYHGYEASMRLNYDEEMGMIVHDHLQDVGTNYADVPSVGVPDGTYEAYELKKGVWQHIVKLKNTEMDEAPRPMPVSKKAKIVDKESMKNFSFPDEVKNGKN